MGDLIAGIIFLVLYILYFLFLIGIILFLIGTSILIGAIGGAVISVFFAVKNYIASFISEIKFKQY